jgi:protein-S-isoprenylcysteine O-methyltransferase Ste14
MPSVFIFLYSVGAYLLSLAAFTYLMLFISPWDILPSHVDRVTQPSLVMALLVDLLLVALFGLQHSIMARSHFKNWLTRFVPQAAERSSYVLMSGLGIALLVIFWQTPPGMVWQVQQPWLWVLLSTLFVIGWSIAVLASFIINHFELFGLQQAWRSMRGRAQASNVFTERSLYRIVRHPIQAGTLIGLWATPVMSLSHVILAAAMSAYIFIGLYYEEKDLADNLGADYRDYQQRIPKLFPSLFRKR